MLHKIQIIVRSEKVVRIGNHIILFQTFIYVYIIICNICEYINKYNGVRLNSFCSCFLTFICHKHPFIININLHNNFNDH